jgi:Tol biopolymer transport system component
MAYVERLQSRKLWRIDFDAGSASVLGDPAPLWRGTRNAMHPAISPDGEWVAYSSSGNQEDIYVMRSDNTDHRQITDDHHKDRGPRWSPDGMEIAFYSNRGGGYDIWSIDREGRGLRPLTTKISGEGSLLCVWSPQKSLLAFLNFALTAKNTLLIDPGKAWSQQTVQTLAPFDGSGEVFAVNSWSPDGDRLAGGAWSADGFKAGVVVYSLESRQYRRLTYEGDFPVWLSDSRRLLYSHEGSLLLVDSETKEVRELLSIEPDVFYETFSISKDNEWISFSRLTREADIWMLTLNEERE